MIYLLLPAFNEEASLPKLFPKIRDVFKSSEYEYQIIVVNDGSYDRTRDILELLEEEGNYPLIILDHSINRGLGETERDAFEYAAKVSDPNDYIVRLEGDDTHDPKYIFTLIAKLEEGYDVVNTSRFQPGGGQVGLNAYRTFISYAANMFMKLLFGIKGVKDHSCGFRAYRAEVIKDAVQIFGNSFFQLRGLGFTSTLETIVKLNLIGCRFAEVPFVLRYDLKESSSKMVGSVTTLGYIVMALLYHWPFGGWKSQYRGLRELYRRDRESAIQKYNIRRIRRRTASRIGG